MTLAVTGLAKTYRGGRRRASTVALDGVDLEVADGELVVVMGPSGSGKSTLLRCIAGLERPDAGAVFVDGREVTAASPGERRLSMVFQDLALYPHLTVAANVGLGLRANGIPKEEVASRVAAAGAALSIDGLLERRPPELSGGERQRVALARAIVREPSGFLLDEPLTHLDTALHAAAREELRALQRRVGVATLYVTHDQVEAMTLGDRIAVLRAGRVEQVGPPLELYDRPATTLVAGLFGTPPMNLLPEGDGHLGVRPEAVVLEAVVGAGGAGDGAGGPTSRFTGHVVGVEQLGAHAVVIVMRERDGSRLAAAVPRADAPPVGAPVGVAFADVDVHRFDAGGRRV